MTLRLSANTIDWGSPIGELFVNSHNVSLDTSYKVQLGSFGPAELFTPTASNTSEWASHWKVFDQAVFNPTDGFFTGTADLNTSGSSNSSFATPGTDFSNLPAYIWIFNRTNITDESTEWALLTKDTWKFETPMPIMGCCDTSNTQFSTGELTTEVPLYGGRNDKDGPGVKNVNRPPSSPLQNVIQTFSFPPATNL